MSQAVRAMFGRIAGRYDLANRVLSARRDVRWRRAALAMLDGSPATVLDLACGTFDLGIEALAQGKAQRVHGSDFCLPMMVAGSAKRTGHPISATTADALHLPFADGAFDAVVIGYGWRNFDDPAAALREMRRVLIPGGQVLILEFFRPQRLWPRLFYGSFVRWFCPVLGRLIAGDSAAYRYLHDSVHRFVSVDEADRLLRANGFIDMRWRSFFGGVSHAVVAATTPAS